MVRIPVGNFGQGVPQRQESRAPVSTGGEYIAQGLSTLARSVQGVADQKAQEARKAEAEAKQKQDEQDQADFLIHFSNFSLEESNLSNIAKQDIETGTDADTAAETYNAELANSWAKTVEKIPQSRRAMAEVAFTRSKNATLSNFQPLAETAKAKNSVAAFGQVFENGLNDANPDRGYATVVSSLDLGVKSGAFSPEFAAKKKQEFKNTRTLSTVKLQLASAVDVAELDKIDAFLKDEKQSANLTLEQRTAFQVQIAGQKKQIEHAGKVATEKRERDSLQAFNQMTDKIQSGGRIDGDAFLSLASQLKGTRLDGQEKILLENYKEVQEFWQMPLPDAAQKIRQKESDALTRETKDPIAYQKWSRAYRTIFDKRMTLAKTAPLDYYTNITGKVKEPIDFSILGQPDGQQKLVGMLNDRMGTISAMQQRDGYVVAANPFYPQEVATIKQILTSSSDDGKLLIMSSLAKAAQIGDRYDNALLTGAINAVTDDNPALKLASFAQAKNLKSTNGASVANLVLTGDRVRKEKTITLPSDMLMQQEFNLAVGAAIPVGSQMHADMLRMTQMVYAGLSARDGKTEQDKDSVDQDIFRVAVGLATGGIGEWGGGKVIKPYAMTDDDFDNKVQAAIVQQASIAGLDYRNFDDTPLVPILNGGEGQYYVSDGRGGIITNPKTKRPLLIEVSK